MHDACNMYVFWRIQITLEIADFYAEKPTFKVHLIVTVFPCRGCVDMSSV